VDGLYGGAYGGYRRGSAMPWENNSYGRVPVTSRFAQFAEDQTQPAFDTILTFVHGKGIKRF